MLKGKIQHYGKYAHSLHGWELNEKNDTTMIWLYGICDATVSTKTRNGETACLALSKGNDKKKKSAYHHLWSSLTRYIVFL